MRVSTPPLCLLRQERLTQPPAGSSLAVLLAKQMIAPSGFSLSNLTATQHNDYYNKWESVGFAPPAGVSSMEETGYEGFRRESDDSNCTNAKTAEGPGCYPWRNPSRDDSDCRIEASASKAGETSSA